MSFLTRNESAAAAPRPQRGPSAGETSLAPAPGSILRVRFAPEAPTASALDWALYDATGTLVDRGRGPPEQWPAAATAEAVVAGAQVRVAVLRLPPLKPPRLIPAALFAIEDQLAGPPEAQHLAVSSQGADGSVRVVIAERDSLRAIQAVAVQPAGWQRIVAEPELVPMDDEWHWCADDRVPGHAFIRLPDGSALATAAPPAGPTVPEELRRLLAKSTPPAAISVHATAPQSLLAAWSTSTGTRFVARQPWRWEECGPASFAAATDLKQGEFALEPTTSSGGRKWRSWRPAVALVAAALGLHVIATCSEWVWLHFDAARDAATWRRLATSAGVVGENATAAQARAALERRFAELRHANGLPAPGDALPLLARAAPALARLPRGTLKGATFAAGAWTVDLGATDEDVLGTFDADLKAAGLPAIIARAGSGVRARFGGSGT